MTNNLVMGTYRSPDDPTTWIRPFASYFISTLPSSFSGNVAAGSGDTGIVLPAMNCSSASAAVGNNEAHSALVGVFILSLPFDCARVTGVTVWKCAHIGVVTVDQVLPRSTVVFWCRRCCVTSARVHLSTKRL